MKKNSSTIIFYLKNHILFKRIFYILKNKNNKVDSMEKQNKYARSHLQYKYDCTNPKTFNEYIGWLKFNYENELWKQCADKILVKEYLSKRGFGEYYPKTLAVYTNSKEIDLSKLPQKFMLKTNHDSGTVFKCDKEKTDFSRVFQKLDDSISHNYINYGEWVYKDIKPLIFAEELLEPAGNDTSLNDYKFFVYNGKYKWGYAVRDREIDSKSLVFESDYSSQNIGYIFPKVKKSRLPEKPKSFEKMIKIAEEIGKDFWFVRVDFYDTNHGPKIGELTFFSQSGVGLFTKKFYDFKYGQYFNETPFVELIKNRKEDL